MAATALLRVEARPSTRRTTRPMLRLVPPLRRGRPRRSYGDLAFATTLTAILAVGIVTVLLLNTSMQTQADHIAATRQQLASLALQVQAAQTALDQEDTPSSLAARATAIGMRPVRRLEVVRVTARLPQRLPATPRVSARARAASPGPGG